MCGRAACGLDPDTICNACGYMTKDGQWTRPRWKQSSDGKEYQASYNICPGSHVPVLLSKEHFPDFQSSASTEVPEECAAKTEATNVTVQCSWVVQPMQWGLVPSWHSGDPKSVMYNMINARSDGILQKRTFKSPLEKGRRCVILIEGFYEWQTQDGKKQPYFIYFPPASESTTEKVNKMSEAGATGLPPAGEWTGKRLLTLAGLFDVWIPKGGGDPVYSCCVITVDAHSEMQWLHHRMPAVLNGEEEVKQWLDFGNMPLSKTFVDKIIRPMNCLQWHPVSTAVNNNRNKSDECVQPIDLEKIRQKEKASSNLMKSWLSGGSRKRQAEDVKPKIEIKTEPFELQEDGKDEDDAIHSNKIAKLECKSE